MERAAMLDHFINRRNDGRNQYRFDAKRKHALDLRPAVQLRPATPSSASPSGSQPNTPQQSGGGIVNRVKASATAQLTTQKDRGIDALGSVTQAVRSTTQKLRDEKHDTIATYVDQAADQIETWSRQLREKDVNEILTDVHRLARRQPAAFIGSAFALGLIGARFLKSSRQRDEHDYGREARRTQDRRHQFADEHGARSKWTGVRRRFRCRQPSSDSRGRVDHARNFVDRNRGLDLQPQPQDRFTHGESVMADRKDDRSLGELLAELSRETGQLVRKEVELGDDRDDGKSQEGGGRRRASRPRAARSCMPACWCSSPRSSSALAQVGVAPWLSALIVAIVTMVGGYLLVNRGLEQMRRTSVAPTQAIEELKETATWTTRQGA